MQKLKYTLILLIAICFEINAQEIYTLQKTLQAARQSNPFLKTEYYNIAIAQSDIITAKLRPNPIFNNQTLQLNQAPANTKWFNGINQQVTWQLSKSFQIAGQRKYKIEVANQNELISAKNYAETERNLFLEVANKWLEVFNAQKQLDILSIASSNIDSLLIINQLRYKNQIITKTDLFRTELLAKQYALQYKKAYQEANNLKSELLLMIGLQNEIRIDTADNFLSEKNDDLHTLILKSLDNRSDLLSVKSLIDVTNSNIKLQKALAFPQPELGFIYNPQNSIPYFGISAAFDLPFFNRNQGEIKKSYILKEQAEQQLSGIKSRLQTEVTISYANYQLLKENAEKFKQLINQSQTILDNVKYTYLKGGTSIIDLLEAQRSWLETQQQYYDTLQQYRQSYVQLLYTTGLINQLAI